MLVKLLINLIYPQTKKLLKFSVLCQNICQKNMCQYVYVHAYAKMYLQKLKFVLNIFIFYHTTYILSYNFCRIFQSKMPAGEGW